MEKRFIYVKEVLLKQTACHTTESNAQAAIRNDEDGPTTESVIDGFIGKGHIQKVTIKKIIDYLKGLEPF